MSQNQSDSHAPLSTTSSSPDANGCPVSAPKSIAERIEAELRDEILRGRYQAGDRLPSERELAERFATHRGAVREALKKLEQLGIADIRPGGARAAPLENASLDVVQHLLALESPPDPKLFDQVFEVFGGLFSLSARLGTERADASQRALGAGIIDRLMGEGLPLAEEHELIHALADLFVEASDNPILMFVRRGLRTQVIDRIPNQKSLLRPPDDERRPLLQQVARAFAAGDGPAASNAAFELIQAVRRNGVKILEEERARVQKNGTAEGKTR